MPIEMIFMRNRKEIYPDIAAVALPIKRKENSSLPRAIGSFSIVAIAPRIAGIESKKENLAAVSLSMPMKVAAAIVAPALDIPGVIASPCTVPTINDLIMPKSFFSPLLLNDHFVNQSIVPVTTSIQPTSTGLPNNCSKRSLKRIAIMAVGTVPIIKSIKRRV
ncbi:MAG: hypothetical protein SCALA701_21650 [Candidatus Scalindua sp.]|nr:MAG: hypothetical protein SCALA701_21650 [Candidatus Scalindua sp.]